MLAKRIMLMYFSNKTYVVGNLFNIVIVVVLFVAFLGDQTANNMEFLLGFAVEGIESIVIGMVFGGLIAMISVGTCLGALQIIVEDWECAAKDFHISPVSRTKISRGYLLGTMAIGIFITLASIVVCLTVMMLFGGSFPSMVSIGRLLLTAVLCVVCSTTLIYLVIVCVKTPNTFHAFSGGLSVFIGFLMGVYVPIAALPEPIQWFMRLFPLTHAAAMFRQSLADEQLSILFADAPPDALETFRTVFGVAFDYGGFISDFWFSAAMLAGGSVLFYVLSVIVVRRKTTHM